MKFDSKMPRRPGKLLSDLGEFRLLKEIIIPTVSDGPLSSPLGDDCAYTQLPDSSQLLVFTSDAAPRPLIWDFTDHAFESWGWYAVAINLSDIAAAGAHPVAFTSSIDAPGSMSADDLKSFFKGITSACRALKTPNGGGNIRSAAAFACHGTAIGLDSTGEPLTRAGCQPDDHVIVVGPSGLFITAFLKAKAQGLGSLSPLEQESLLRPRPKVREMEILHRAGVLSAASDNSDGVLGALWNIAERSNRAFELELLPDHVPNEVLQAATSIGADPWNLMFCWGDWQVVVTVKRNELARFNQIAKDNQIEYLHLGKAVTGPPSLVALCGAARRRLNVVRNENFTKTGFNASSEENLQYMLHTPLV